MDINIKTWLVDIQQSIEEINDFLGERRDFFAYQNDLKTKKAVERNLEIIGEAVNRIIHSYDNISDEVIWTIVSRDLPILKAQVDKHLME